MIKAHYPVTIVGGGLAGASLALALAKLGIECAVFEAFAEDSTEQPSFDDRTVALSAASLEIFSALHLGKELSQIAEPIDSIHISEQGKSGFSRLSSQRSGVKQLGAVVENWQLGKLLLESIKQNPLIDYHFTAQVKTLKQNSEQASLTIEQAEQAIQSSSSLVVLADGARSPLRQQLQIESELVDYEKSAVVCNIQTQLPHNNEAFERFTADGPLALLPLSRNRISIVWSKQTSEAADYLAMSEQEFANKLEQEFGARLGRVTKVGKRATFPLMQQKSKQLFRNRCVLLANAAQSLHPIAGQGFNLGLRDLVCLSSVLAEVKSSSESKTEEIDYGRYATLRAYEKLRQQDREKTLYITESLARLFANQNTLMSLSRNLLLKGLDIIPWAKNWLAYQAMGLDALGNGINSLKNDEKIHGQHHES